MTSSRFVAALKKERDALNPICPGCDEPHFHTHMKEAIDGKKYCPNCFTDCNADLIDAENRRIEKEYGVFNPQDQI